MTDAPKPPAGYEPRHKVFPSWLDVAVSGNEHGRRFAKYELAVLRADLEACRKLLRELATDHEQVDGNDAAWLLRRHWFREVGCWPE